MLSPNWQNQQKENTGTPRGPASSHRKIHPEVIAVPGVKDSWTKMPAAAGLIPQAFMYRLLYATYSSWCLSYPVNTRGGDPHSYIPIGKNNNQTKYAYTR